MLLDAKTGAPPESTRTAAAAALGPHDYALDLDRLGCEALANQLRALVVLRQPDLRVLADPAGLGAAAIAAQTGIGRAARYYLNVVLPQLQLQVAEATALSHLMRGLNTALADVTTPAEAAAAMAEVTGQMRDYQEDAQEALRMTRLHSELTGKALKELDAAIDAAIAELDGKDGRIARTNAAIERTETAINAAIRTIVSNSNVIGAGVKSIATYVFKLFGGGEDKPDKDAKDKSNDKPADKTKDKTTGKDAGKDNGKDAAKDGAADAGKKPQPAATGGDKTSTDPAKPTKENPDTGKIAEFPAETITTISEGAEGLEQAQQAIRKGNELLAQQYGELADMGAMLAAVRVIRSQTVGIDDAASRLATVAAESYATLATITTAVTAMQQRLAEGAGLAENAAALSATLAAWTRMGNRTRQIERNLSGSGTLFPEI